MEKQTFFRKCKATLSALNKFRIEKNITFSAMRVRFFGFSNKFKENVPTAIQNMATDEVTDYFMSVKKIRYLRIAGVTSLFVLLILATCFAHPFMSYSEEVEAADDNETPSIEMQFLHQDASISIKSDSIEGNFIKSTQQESIDLNVITTNVDGYSLRMLVTENNALKNAEKSAEIASITDKINEETFQTNAGLNGKYGLYHYVVGSNSSENTYLPAPIADDDKGILLYNAATSSGQDRHVIGFGARVNNSQPDGIYMNKNFRLEAVVNNIPYSIKYSSGDASGEFNNMPLEQIGFISSTDTSVNLSEQIPTRTKNQRGYELSFRGWCETVPTQDGTHCNGDIYSAGSEYRINITESSDITLYAVWGVNTYVDGDEHIDSIDFGDSYNTVKRCPSEDDHLCKLTDLEFDKEYYIFGVGKSGYNSSEWQTDTPYGTPIQPNGKFKIASDKTEYDYAYAIGKPNINSLMIKFDGDKVDSVDVYNGDTLVGTADEPDEEVGPLTYDVIYTLHPNIKDGYAFSSWGGKSDDDVELITPTNPNSGIIVGPENGVVTLNVTTYSGEKYMQDFSDADAAAMDENETKILTDNRDNQDYIVAKIKDGFSYNKYNIWMIRNLAIGCNGQGSNYGDWYSVKVLTNSDSNVLTDWATPDRGLTLSLEDYQKPGMECSRTYGAWYNYAAISAGTITGEDNYDNLTSSICPKNWRLPTSTEFASITTTTSDISILSLDTGAYYDYDGASFNDSQTLWWSSGINTGKKRYVLKKNNNDSNVRPTINASVSRRDGAHIRCIFDPSPAQSVTMQSFSDLDATSMLIGETRKLKDDRDGQEYIVSKLKDGNVWMVDNLNLGATALSTDLTSANTNISTTVAASTFNSWIKAEGAIEWTYEKGVLIARDETDSTSQTKIGALYNYCAASAGTVCTSSASGDPTTDICPAGWRLPYGYERDGHVNDYKVLWEAYGSKIANMTASLNDGGAAFSKNTGYWANSSGTITEKDQGYYWTSSRPASEGAYKKQRIRLASGIAYEGMNQRAGATVRCIKKKN